MCLYLTAVQLKCFLQKNSSLKNLKNVDILSSNILTMFIKLAIQKHFYENLYV